MKYVVLTAEKKNEVINNLRARKESLRKKGSIDALISLGVIGAIIEAVYCEFTSTEDVKRSYKEMCKKWGERVNEDYLATLCDETDKFYKKLEKSL